MDRLLDKHLDAFNTFIDATMFAKGNGSTVGEIPLCY